ncbi:MAG: ArnT family glycosyltransferase [Acidimicrobiales bacterium]
MGDAVAPDAVASDATDAEPAAPQPGAARPRWFVIGLVVVVLAGWAIRLLYVWHWRQYTLFGGDPLYYHSGAKLLASGHGFVNPYAYARDLNVQAADHPPLYLMYLAVFSLFGMGTITWHLLASTLLGAASIAVAGLAGREIVGPRAGLIAAALVAIYPNTWRYDGMMLSETLVILMVLLSVWMAYRFWHDPTAWRLVAVGVTVGLGTLARSELVLMAPFLVLPLALLTPGRAGRDPVASSGEGVTGRGRAPWRRRFALLGIGAVAFAAVVGPWVVFNLVRFDHPVILSENLGGTLATSNCDAVYYGDQVGYWNYFCGQRILEENGIGPYAFKGASDRILRQEALRYIADHKSRVPIVVAARVGRITGLYKPQQEAQLDVYLENTEQWVSDSGLVAYYIVAGLAVVGAVVLRRRREAVFPLLAPVVTVIVTVAMFYAATRFRATAEGALCLLAAVAIDAAIGAVRSRPASDADADAGRRQADDTTGQPVGAPT